MAHLWRGLWRVYLKLCATLFIGGKQPHALLALRWGMIAAGDDPAVSHEACDYLAGLAFGLLRADFEHGVDGAAWSCG